jgi:hypothetical protein
LGISPAFAAVAITALTLAISLASLAALAAVATTTASSFAARWWTIRATTFEAGTSAWTSWRWSWWMMFFDEIGQLHEFIAA